jgi:hypothetical protein
LKHQERQGKIKIHVGFEERRGMELDQDYVYCICSIEPSGFFTGVITISGQHCCSPCSIMRLGPYYIVRQNIHRIYKLKHFWYKKEKERVAGQSTVISLL